MAKLYLIGVSLAVGVHCAGAFSLPSNARGSTPAITARLRAEIGRPNPSEDPIPITAIDDDDDDEMDALVDSLTEKLGEMEGIWYTDDFYGPHGREWVKVSSTILGETATTALVAVKVTGDPNVPAGRVTFRTRSWPDLGENVPAQIQVRADPQDPDGFSWLQGELTFVAKRELRLMCRYNSFAENEGRFYKQNEDNGDGDSGASD